MTATSTSTTAGSNWRPEQPRISASAAPGVSAPL
jgi:hypothetical protein